APGGIERPGDGAVPGHLQQVLVARGPPQQDVDQPHGQGGRGDAAQRGAVPAGPVAARARGLGGGARGPVLAVLGGGGDHGRHDGTASAGGSGAGAGSASWRAGTARRPAPRRRSRASTATPASRVSATSAPTR